MSFPVFLSGIIPLGPHLNGLAVLERFVTRPSVLELCVDVASVEELWVEELYLEGPFVIRT